MNTTLYAFTLRHAQAEIVSTAEDQWEASKNFRQLCRQGYFKKGRFAKSMKPLFFEGAIQVRPGIPIDEYEDSDETCDVCNYCNIKTLNPDFINAELIHCPDCSMTMIRKRATSE